MKRLVRALAVALMIVFAPIAAAQVKAGGMLTSEADTVLTLRLEMMPNQIQTSR